MPFVAPFDHGLAAIVTVSAALSEREHLSSKGVLKKRKTGSVVTKSMRGVIKGGPVGFSKPVMCIRQRTDDCRGKARQAFVRCLSRIWTANSSLVTFTNGGLSMVLDVCVKQLQKIRKPHFKFDAKEVPASNVRTSAQHLL